MQSPVVGGRDIRLDILAKDSTGKHYNVEVQKKPELAKGVRHFKEEGGREKMCEAVQDYAEQKSSLVMLDIDNFKQVNDTYGHQEGDAVIIGLADILHNERSGHVSSGRWGGEEFMMLLHDTDVNAAAYIADLIRQCFANTKFPSVRTQTVSLGVTQAKADDTLDILCMRVDEALYKAKKDGKNRVTVV